MNTNFSTNFPTHFSSPKNILSAIAATIAIFLLAFSFTSCSSEADEPSAISTAKVKFKYTVPEELFRYAEITVCRNNNEGTDAEWFPMLDRTVTVDYELSKFHTTVPVVMVYDTTNRPAYGVNVDWDITMDIEVSMEIGGTLVTKNYQRVYDINGDLGAAIDSLIKNVKDRTYAVKISNNGDLEFI